MSEAPTPVGRRYLWLLVPALAWGGVIAGLLLPSPPFPLPPGNLGCVLGSVAIAALALTRERKDLVSLCIPIFAFMIFIAPLETPPGLAIQILYAISLTAVAVRLERKFPPGPAAGSVA
ncbi:MAG TPA: hypothetical protein VEI51_01680 [Methanomicrobiales archaeon]|nr:hypothetical protein [Methanomicrobiales archaeon]